MKYKIVIYENGRYMDDEGSHPGTEFENVADATAHARSIVDEDLRALKKEGMSAEELFSHYTLFGSEPLIVPEGEASFSAWEYARSRCAELCARPHKPARERRHL